MQERPDTPDPVKLAGLSVQAVLLLVRLIAPAKWLKEVTVTVEVAGELI